MRAPSKKVSAVMLVVVLVVVIIIISSLSDAKKRSQDNTDNLTDLSLQIDLLDEPSRDADGDGLADWEEVLWSTNPNSPDTDGDGTTDNEETRLNRNPTKAGPDDENYNLDEKILGNLGNDVDKSTITNKTTVSLLDKYFKLKQSGQYDQTTKQVLIDSLVAEVVKSVSAGFVYSPENLIGFNITESDKALNYANTISQTWLQIGQNIKFLSASGNTTSIPSIIIGASSDLSKIEVPNNILFEHLYLINNLYKLGEVSNNVFNENPDDPILSTVSMLLLNELTQSIDKNLSNIYSYLNANGIILNENSGLFELKDD